MIRRRRRRLRHQVQLLVTECGVYTVFNTAHKSLEEHQFDQKYLSQILNTFFVSDENIVNKFLYGLNTNSTLVVPITVFIEGTI